MAPKSRPVLGGNFSRAWCSLLLARGARPHQHFEDFEKNAVLNFEEIEKNHIKNFEETGIYSIFAMLE